MTAIEEEVLDHEIALIGHVHLAAHALGEVLSIKTLDSAHVERFDLFRFTSMRAKMNCTVRFGKQFLPMLALAAENMAAGPVYHLITQETVNKTYCTDHFVT